MWYPSCERWLCWYPSSERWLWRLCWFPSTCRGDCGVVSFEPYPSIERLIVVWLSVHPSKCRGDLLLCLASYVEVVFIGERSCVHQVVFAQFLSGGSLCGKSCVDDIVKILLCEDGDIELGARTSKHILVFAFDPLSPTLSLILCIASYYSYHIYMLRFDCVPCLC